MAGVYWWSFLLLLAPVVVAAFLPILVPQAGVESLRQMGTGLLGSILSMLTVLATFFGASAQSQVMQAKELLVQFQRPGRMGPQELRSLIGQYALLRRSNANFNLIRAIYTVGTIAIIFLMGLDIARVLISASVRPGATVENRIALGATLAAFMLFSLTGVMVILFLRRIALFYDPQGVIGQLPAPEKLTDLEYLADHKDYDIEELLRLSDVHVKLWDNRENGVQIELVLPVEFAPVCFSLQIYRSDDAKLRFCAFCRFQAEPGELRDQKGLVLRVFHGHLPEDVCRALHEERLTAQIQFFDHRTMRGLGSFVCKPEGPRGQLITKMPIVAQRHRHWVPPVIKDKLAALGPNDILSGFFVEPRSDIPDTLDRYVALYLKRLEFVIPVRPDEVEDYRSGKKRDFVEDLFANGRWIIE